MKKFALTFFTVRATCAFAFAGPEALSSGKEVIPTPVSPASCFAGWYLGIHGGALLTNFDTDTSASARTVGARGRVDTAFDSTNGGDHDASAEGGLQGGYNFQRGEWIFGLEVDISAAVFERKESARAVIMLDQNMEFPGPFFYTTVIRSKTELDWYSTLRPRFGHTLGQRVYLFGTGGLAFGSSKVSETTDVSAETPGGSTGGALSDGDREVEFGWTAGAGIDFCLTERVILNFTYLYVDLGDASASDSFSGTTPVLSGTGFRSYESRTHTSSDLQFHVIQAGLSLKF